MKNRRVSRRVVPGFLCVLIENLVVYSTFYSYRVFDEGGNKMKTRDRVPSRADFEKKKKPIIVLTLHKRAFNSNFRLYTVSEFENTQQRFACACDTRKETES